MIHNALFNYKIGDIDYLDDRGGLRLAGAPYFLCVLKSAVCGAAWLWQATETAYFIQFAWNFV